LRVTHNREYEIKMSKGRRYLLAQFRQSMQMVCYQQSKH
jgi:hypothetical protein